jgi:hypothetical protein
MTEVREIPHSVAMKQVLRKNESVLRSAARRAGPRARRGGAHVWVMLADQGAQLLDALALLAPARRGARSSRVKAAYVRAGGASRGSRAAPVREAVGVPGEEAARLAAP